MVYRQHKPRLVIDTNYWIAVMKVAHFCECQSAKVQARDRLVFRLTYLDDEPIPAITFGLDYKIRKWFEAGFRALAKQSFMCLSAENSEKIGWRVAAAVHKTQLAISQYRRQVAVLPPQVVHDPNACVWEHRPQCEKNFETGWWLEVGRFLLDPEYSHSCDELKDRIPTFRFPGMSSACWARTLEQRGVWDHIFDQEDVILAECTEKLQQQFGPWFEIASE